MDKDEKLLPQPHDMLLPATEDELAGSKQQTRKSFLSRSSAIKWQLIVVLIVLLLTALIFIATSRREPPPAIENPPTMTPVITQAPTNTPASSSPEISDWTSFSYTNNGQKMSLKYPPGMKVSTNTKASAINPDEKVPTITFTDTGTTITLTLEKNTQGALNNWVAAYGTKQATQAATLNKHQVITQYAADKLNLNAYLIFDSDTILWARSTTKNNDEDNFKILLSTLQIGK